MFIVHKSNLDYFTRRQVREILRVDFVISVESYTQEEVIETLSLRYKKIYLPVYGIILNGQTKIGSNNDKNKPVLVVISVKHPKKGISRTIFSIR